MKPYIKTAIFLGTVALALGISTYAANEHDGSTAGKDTEVIEVTEYTSCEHKDCKEYDLPGKYVGKAASEIAESLGLKLKSFKDGRLIIQQTKDGYCRLHCEVFIKGNNVIAVKSLYDGEIKKEYFIDAAKFSDKDMQRLKSGIITNSESELAAVIEDYTS